MGGEGLFGTALFRNREEAGRRLAEALRAWRGRPDVVVLGLPRGGVPVAAAVSRELGAPLDVFVVRKLGVPGHLELAAGALASGGVRVDNEDVIQALGLSAGRMRPVVEREARELERRESAYRRGRPPLQVAGRTCLVIDDGLATGSTMLAAVKGLRALHPARVVVAVPVGARESCADLRAVADEVVCLESPEPFYGIGLWYGDFSQTSDEEVRELLDEAAVTGRGPR